MQPKVSVITVVRNGARYMAQALESIAQQDYAPVQVIVVDGQSTDGSDCIAQSYAGVLYVRQETLGLAQARNLGLAYAEGEIIAFLDHDDLWLRDKLTQQVGFMVQHPGVSYCTTSFEWFVDPEFATASFHQDRPLATPQAAPTPSTLAARPSAFVENGLFAEELTLACDSEWFARARRRGLPSAHIPQVLVKKRLHNANLSLQVEQYRAEWLRVLRSLHHAYG